MPDRIVRKYIDLIRQASGKWCNWDPPFPVYVGDYGIFNESGEFTVEGNVYHDDFKKYIRDNGFSGDFDLKPHPPQVAESSESHIIISSGVRKEEPSVDQQANVPGIGPSVFKGTWRFPSNKRGALLVLIGPRQIHISPVALEKLLQDRLLEGKYLATRVFACPAYLQYLSEQSGDSISVALRASPAGLGAVNLSGWWTSKESNMLRSAFNPNIKYRYTPLFKLQQIGKRPYSVWKREEHEGDYVWHDVYPDWKPLDQNGEEIED